jgi:predicted  nucleic acid-binding Zn-ribbon protein
MNQEITTTMVGVKLHKYYEIEEYEVPSIVYEFTSRHPDGVEVHLAESVPTDLDPADVGFHPDFGEENWEIADDTLQFDYYLDQGETYRTVIAVDPAVDFDCKRLLTEPETFEVGTPNQHVDGGELSPAASPEGSFLRSANAATEQDDETWDGSLELDDPNESSEVSPTEPATDGSGISRQADGDTDGGSGESDTDRADGSTGSSEGEIDGDDLARQLEAGTFSDDSLRTLRRQLLGEDAVPGSVDARLDRLQDDVSKLRAYTSALEEFLDEEGSAEEIISRFDDRLRSFENELSSFETGLGSLQDDVHTFESQLGTVEEGLDSVGSDVHEIESRLESVENQVDSVVDDVGGVEESVATLEGGLESVTTRSDGQDRVIVSLMGDIEERAQEHDALAMEVSTVHDELDEFSSDVSRIEGRLPDGDIEARFESLEDQMAEATDVIDRIHDAFDATR